MPGETYNPTKSDSLTAVPVEWSGLESKSSHAIEVTKISRIQIIPQSSDDFSWTRNVYYVKDLFVDKENAMRAKSFRENTVHLYDGVIHRSWYKNEMKVRQDDINVEGKTIRRLTFSNGNLEKRAYYKRDGELLSEERFDSNGFLTDVNRYSDSRVNNH